MATSSRDQRAFEPVDERFLSGRPKMAANVRVADAPKIFRMKRHRPAAFRTRGRHRRDQADARASCHQGEDTRELSLSKMAFGVIRALAACR
jgi:hypothetical protein